MKSYEELLKKAKEQLPEVSSEKARFEIPVFESFIQGAETIISNFLEVANKLERDPAHLQKFILSEAGTSGTLSGQRLAFKGNKTPKFLNSKLTDYYKAFVSCKQCNLPDTILNEGDDSAELKCKACGTKYMVKVL